MKKGRLGSVSGRMHPASAIAIAIAFAFALCAFARKDQEWLNFSVDYEVYKNVMLHFDQEIEYDDTRLANEESYLSVGYRFCPYFSLAMGYRVVREREAATRDFHTEHRPTPEMTISAPEFWTLKLDLRSRFEFRDKSRIQPYMRYRERFRLRTSWSVTDFEISPYASEELFFSDKPGVSGSDLLDATRSQVGLSFRPVPCIEHLSCRMYFMVLHSIGHGARDWEPLNIYGFEAGYSF